jgi:thiamine-monophosphate kinase
VPFRNETEFVRWLGRRWPQRGRGLALGIGDDAALIGARPGHDLVLTTDFSIEGIHFLAGLHPARSVGHRALARTLSDLAAMGAQPRFALISLALSRRLARSWIAAFYEGFGALARRFNVNLIGGDTAVVDGATLVDVIAIGEVRRGHSLLRSGARPGDRIYVSGRLGLSALGLDLARQGARPPASAPPVRPPVHARDAAWKQEALAAHFYPEPRCTAAIALSRRGLPSAAIDVSDGFAADLARLCESSGCGAAVREAQLPLPQPTAGRDPLDLALRGGEDYELIFTVPPSRAGRVPRTVAGVRLQEVGEIRTGRSVVLVRADGREAALDARGYDHFRKPRARARD